MNFLTCDKNRITSADNSPKVWLIPFLWMEKQKIVLSELPLLIPLQIHRQKHGQNPTNEGSNSFQVMVFQSNSTNFKTTSHLCICDHCLIDCGPCSLFSLHELRRQILRKIFLCSEVEINGPISDDQTEDASDDLL